MTDACQKGCGRVFRGDSSMELAEAHEAKCDGTPRAAKKPTERVRRARSGPTNSAGEPWAEGQSWTCARCGGSGPDRDDRVLSACLPREGAAPHMAWHELAFVPPSHAAKIAARKESRS